MNFKNLATQVLMRKIGDANNSDDAASALDKLVGGRKGFDLGEIVGKFQGSGGQLANKAKSWLGDGPNESISATQVQEVIGSDKIAAFASKIGIDRETASRKLAAILPELIDKSSQGGELLNAASGKSKGVLAGLASRLLRQ